MHTAAAHIIKNFLHKVSYPGKATSRQKNEETRLPFFARRFCFAIGTAKTVFYFKVSCSPSYSCAVGNAPIAGIFFL